MNNMARNTSSWKDIKVTAHARERAQERMGICTVSEIRKLAHAARHKGLSLKNLSWGSCNKYDLDYDAFKEIASRFTYESKAMRIFYWRDFFYLFASGDSRTLLTMVNFNRAEYDKIRIRNLEIKIRKVMQDGKTEGKQKQTKGQKESVNFFTSYDTEILQKFNEAYQASGGKDWFCWYSDEPNQEERQTKEEWWNGVIRAYRASELQGIAEEGRGKEKSGA